MKHQAIEQLQGVAEVKQDLPRRTLSRKERLQRWAELLNGILTDAFDAARDRVSASESPRGHARRRFADLRRLRGSGPRTAGMENDSYGEARRFFELNDEQLHKVICYCHFGATVSASTAARHIRAMLVEKQPGLFARLRQMFVG